MTNPNDHPADTSINPPAPAPDNPSEAAGGFAAELGQKLAAQIKAEEAGGASSPSASASDFNPVLPTAPPDLSNQPPVSFRRQVAQLVIIPAAITVACITVAVIFGILAGRPDSLDDELLRLSQSSGSGRLALGLQDPRYKDRSLAAANIAVKIPKITDPQTRADLSRQLIDILKTSVGQDEDMLKVYLLMAIGQLGQDGGLQILAASLASDRPTERQGAIRGLLSWPDASQTRSLLPRLQQLLQDTQPQVAAEAAAAVGHIAQPGDPAAIAALQDAATRTGPDSREVQWNAAVAQAKLADPQGSRAVAQLLLDRTSLAQLPASESGPASHQKMPQPLQDRVILATLASAKTMTHPIIWDKIKALADNDPSLLVRKQANELLLWKKTKTPTTDHSFLPLDSGL